MSVFGKGCAQEEAHLLIMVVSEEVRLHYVSLRLNIIVFMLQTDNECCRAGFIICKVELRNWKTFGLSILLESVWCH